MRKGQIPLEWIYSSITEGPKDGAHYWSYSYITTLGQNLTVL